MQRDKKDLKIQALLERISNLTATYEDRIADLRVEITVAEEAQNELLQRLSDAENPDVGKSEPGEVVQGEVVYPNEPN